MHTTIARKVTHSRAPRADRDLLRPFRRAPDVAQRLTKAHGSAIDARCDEVAESARHRIDHRVVDQAHSLRNMTASYEHGAFAHQPARDEIDVVARAPDPQ